MNKKVIKSGIWYTISNFVVKSMGFITTPIFTRIMSQGEYGDFSNFLSWSSILIILISLNLEATLIRAKYDYEDELDSYILSMFMLSMVSWMTWFLIIHNLNSYFINWFSMDSKYINAMLLYILFQPAINIFQAIERYKYRYKWSVAISLLISISSSVLSVLLVINLNDHLWGRTLGYVSPVVIVGILVMIYFSIKGKKIIITSWKYALQMCIPYIPHLLSMLLLGSMDRIMIKKICGSEANALYSVAYSCGMMISILVTSLNNAFSPWLGEKLHYREYSQIKRISIPYVMVMTIASAGAMLVAPELIYVLGGKSYTSAKFVIPPVLAGCFCQFLYCMYVNIEQYERKTVGMAFASLSAAMLNGVLNYIFIPKYGYVAAAYTTLAGYMWLLFIHMFLVKKIGFGKVYYNKFNIIIAIFIALYSMIMNFIYKSFILRYTIIIIFVLFFIVLIKSKWNKIVNEFKQIKSSK